MKKKRDVERKREQECQMANERKINDVVGEKRSSNLQLLLPFRLVAVVIVASRFICEYECHVLSLDLRF